MFTKEHLTMTFLWQTIHNFQNYSKGIFKKAACNARNKVLWRD